MMNENLEKLIDVLVSESRLYEKLLAILGSELKALRAASMDQLEETNGEKGQVLNEIRKQELQRIDLFSALMADLGEANENARLDDLLRRTPAPWAGRLMDVKKQLQQIVRRVHESNARNRGFIEEIGGVIDGLFSGLREVFAEPATYGNGGKVNGQPLGGGGFVSKAV